MSSLNSEAEESSIVGTPRKTYTRIKGKERVVDKVVGQRFIDGELQYLVKWKDDDVYIVEKILDERTSSNNSVEYFIKWKNFSDEDNTWEPSENIECPEKLKEYLKCEYSFLDDVFCDSDVEEKVLEEKKVKRTGKEEWIAASEINCQDEIREFLELHALKCEARSIVGVISDGDTVSFVVEWKDTNITDLVSSEEVKKRFPQLLLEFYESKMIFDDTDELTHSTSVSGNGKNLEYPKIRTFEMDKQINIEAEDDELEDVAVYDSYDIEEILDKRVYDEAIQYKIKRNPSDSGIWVPSCNLDCFELIVEFEKNYVEGFQNNWTVEKVLNYVEGYCDEIYFEIKWLQSTKTEHVLAAVAREFYMLKVIEFYESLIKLE